MTEQSGQTVVLTGAMALTAIVGRLFGATA